MTRDQGLRMASCSEVIEYAMKNRGCHGIEWQLSSGHFCQVRLCPVCEWRKARAWRGRILAGLQLHEYEHPTDTAVMLTLTVRNVPVHQLGESLDHLHRSWNRLQRAPFFPTKLWLRRTEVTLGNPSMPDGLPKAPVIQGRLPGSTGLSAADREDPTVTKRNVATIGGLWAHPHIHALLVVPASYWGAGYIKQVEWIKQWALAAQIDYQPTVDIRKAYVNPDVITPDMEKVAALTEVVKYVAKSQDITKLGDLAPDYMNQLQGRRMIAASKAMGKLVKMADIRESEMLDVVLTQHARNKAHLRTFRWDQVLDQYIHTP